MKRTHRHFETTQDTSRALKYLKEPRIPSEHKCMKQLTEPQEGTKLGANVSMHLLDYYTVVIMTIAGADNKASMYASGCA